MPSDAVIVGWSHIRFGKLADPDTESLIGQVALPAIEHAGVASSDIDSIHVGVMNNGFSRQDFQAALVALVDPALTHTPATRHENACATGSAALHAAMNDIQSGHSRLSLVVGAEKMTGVSNRQIGDVLLGASYRSEEMGPKGFPGVFAGIANAYFERHGDRSEELALIATKNHANGVANPWAHVRRDLGFEFCNTAGEKNPYVAEPLRRTDCSMVSDGAAALVIADRQTAQSLERAIGFRARTQANDIMPLSRRDPLAFAGAARAWRQALDRAEITLDDLSLVETHDCFTIAELIEYEAMGLTPPGEGYRAIREGWTRRDGRLPVNPSGGLKAKGHPIGATGVSMHVMACLQLMGEAGDMQIPGAELAGVFNMGGAAVANYVSIMARVK